MNIASPAVFNAMIAPIGGGIVTEGEDPSTPSATIDAQDGKSNGN